MFKKLTNWFKNLLFRSKRIELAEKVAKAVKSFSDTKADDIIFYVLTLVAPASSSIVTLIKSFVSDDLPTLVYALELMDVSDDSSMLGDNTAATATKIKSLGALLDEETIKKAILLKMEKDNKLSLTEAKELVKEYLSIKIK